MHSNPIQRPAVAVPITLALAEPAQVQRRAPRAAAPAQGQLSAQGVRTVAQLAIGSSMATTRRALAAAEDRQGAERRVVAGAVLVMAGAAVVSASDLAPAQVAIGAGLMAGGALLVTSAAQTHRQANERLQEVAQRVDHAAALLAFGQPD